NSIQESRPRSNLTGAPSMKSPPSVIELRRELERCDREIKQCILELQNGNPDVYGALRGVVDWSTEKRMIEAELSGPPRACTQTDHPGAVGGESRQAPVEPG